MNVSKINKILGYLLFIVGVLKILIAILVLIQMGNNITAIFNGGSGNSEYYPTLSITIGLVQIILALSSIIMIIVNANKQPKVIIGYLYGLGALLLEFIVPSILSFYFVFVESGLYMKAGNKIINTNLGYGREYKKNKEMIKNTEWFYSQRENYNNSKQEVNTNNNTNNELEKEEYFNEENYIKENRNTILMIIFIILIILAFIIFIVMVKKDYNDQNINIAVAQQPNFVVNAYSEKKPELYEEANNKKDIINIQNDKPILNRMSEIFENTELAEVMRKQGYTMDATVFDDIVIISSIGQGVNFNIKFTLDDDNILYSEILYNKTNPEITLAEAIIATLFLDSAGQIKGYKEGTLYKALVGENLSKYTIESEGVEIKNIGHDNYDIYIKIDLNSNFSFLNYIN